MSNEFIYDRRAVNLYGLKHAYTALFVSSVSSNNEPLTPHWWLYSFSKKEDAMDRVLKYAHYCDEGMTRGPRGVPLSTVGEIKKWREAIKNAVKPQWDCRTPVRFFKDEIGQQNSVLTMEKVKEFAQDRNHALTFVDMPGPRASKIGLELLLNLASAADADFAWEITRAGLRDPSPGSSDTRILHAEELFRSLAFECSYMAPSVFLADPLATNTVARKVKRFEAPTVLKFELSEFPEQPDYRETRFALLDDGKLTSWGAGLTAFCRHQLVTRETLSPGTAEDEVMKFKAWIKELPTLALEAIEVRVKRPDIMDVPDWCNDKVWKLFCGAQLVNADAAWYVMEPECKLAALNLSDVLSIEIHLVDVGAVQKSEEQVSLFA